MLLPVQSIRRPRMIDEPEYKYLSLRNQSSTVALQHLRYAVISAEYGSFRRAAEALLMRQSTLSRCIRQLEESIGVTVFERFPSTVTYKFTSPRPASVRGSGPMFT